MLLNATSYLFLFIPSSNLKQMSRQINQPINQVRLTNVATVRMNRGGKRFEIACYRNKVVNYRQGLETDLSEVLQTDRIFTNVSKGQFAKSSDLEQVFQTRNEQDIAKLILEKGSLQVSDLERSQQIENTLREVATWVANNCVSRESQRPFTVPQIRHAMKQAEFAPHPTRSVKRQYLDCYKLLQEKDILPIERAKMKLLLVYPVSQEAIVLDQLGKLEIVPMEETASKNNDEAQTTVLVDPSLYRDLDEICKNATGRLEIVQQVVRQEGDVDLELEMERKKNQATTTVASNEEAQLANAMEQTLFIDNVQSKTDSTSESTPSPLDKADNDEDLYGSHNADNTMRQNQKKANKKSKKAKRREKEETVERQARIDAEKQRQEERAKTMGTTQGQETLTDTQQGEAKTCNTCGGSFPSAAAYRAHFRSDWHRYNIKLKMNGVAPVSEQEFLLCDSDAFFEDM